MRGILDRIGEGKQLLVIVECRSIQLSDNHAGKAGGTGTKNCQTVVAFTEGAIMAPILCSPTLNTLFCQKNWYQNRGRTEWTFVSVIAMNKMKASSTEFNA